MNIPPCEFAASQIRKQATAAAVALNRQRTNRANITQNEGDWADLAQFCDA